jgi:L-lactate dehydrogenase (cytochrome)
MNMRLLGATTIKEVVPEMVDASNIHSHLVAVPSDRLYEGNCESYQKEVPVERSDIDDR